METKIKIPAGVEVRFTEPSDAKYLKEWLSDPSVDMLFSMYDQVEIEDAVLRWISFCRYKCSITILKDGIPCGLGTLYLQPYQRLAHQTEFGIVVDHNLRGQGIGSYLMACLMHLAKVNFHIELLHLTANPENPAITLYKRFGFKEYARQPGWIKDGSRPVGRIMMERRL